MYNLGLETKTNAYATHKKTISSYDLIKQLPEFKDISKPKLINDCKFYLDTSELVFTKAISNRSLKRGIK